MPTNPPNRKTITIETYKQQQTESNRERAALPDECQTCRYPKRPGELFCPPCPHQDEYETLNKLPAGEKEPVAPIQSLPANRGSGPVEENPLASEPEQQQMSSPAEEPALTPIPAPTPPIPGRKPRGTYNPYTDVPPRKPTFRLVAIARQYETPSEPLPFEGEMVVLNRHQLDPDNLTISGHEHARVYLSDGRWMLENRSITQATYVRVDTPVVLKSGDVVLMGNRMFRFDAD